jgi:hypothetical protein
MGKNKRKSQTPNKQSEPNQGQSPVPGTPAPLQQVASRPSPPSPFSVSTSSSSPNSNQSPPNLSVGASQPSGQLATVSSPSTSVTPVNLAATMSSKPIINGVEVPMASAKKTVQAGQSALISKAARKKLAAKDLSDMFEKATQVTQVKFAHFDVSIRKR